MPGPDEQEYELESSRVPASDGASGTDPPRPRDRPAAGSTQDLRRRQNELPPGHPSSRFNDDGTPKAALVPLGNLELPEHSDEREHNGAGSDQAAKNGQPDTGQADTRQANTGRPENGQPENGQPENGQPENGQPENGQADGDAWAESAGEQEAAAPEQEGTRWDEHADDEINADAESATQDHEPIADDPAPTPVERPEAKPAESLSPEQVRIAVRAHGRCRLAEGRSVIGVYGERGLTPAMRRIEEQLDHGELVPDTEKYALKSLDRFQEKLAKQIRRNPDKSSEELAHEIHDGVRYTFVFDEDRYYDATWQAHSKLEEQGFDLEFRRNTWADPEYKGINSRWHDPTHDTVFEVQFHTEASWDAKQRTHDAYQKISDTTIPIAERTRLQDEQKGISATVPLPPRCTEIPDYRKEGK
jgi:hypothetical protein